MINFDLKTRKLLQSATNGRIGIRAFEAALPEVAKQIRDDGESGCLQYWGQSLNFDEFENETIVDPKLLNVIGRLAKFSIRDGNKFHAGLMHTYGYLFSLLATRYGYKRERWTLGVIESGFGIRPGTFSPAPDSGTLLQNVTWLASNLAFDKPPCDVAAPKIAGQFSFDRLEKMRITEAVSIKSERSKRQKVTIRTDVVSFPRPTKTAEALLVYSYRVARSQKLVTCFPIDGDAVALTLEQARAADGIVRPRFNLQLDGLPEDGIRGQRETR